MIEAKTISGYPDYKIDKYGNVYSFKWGKIKKLRPFTCKSAYGHLLVTLSEGCSITRQFKICNLMAITFLQWTDNDNRVIHIDKDRKNNKLKNLKFTSNIDLKFKGTVKNSFTPKQELNETLKTMSQLWSYLRHEDHCSFIQEDIMQKGVCDCGLFELTHSDIFQKAMDND